MPCRPDVCGSQLSGEGQKSDLTQNATGRDPSYWCIKWIIFVVFMFTLPAMLFLVAALLFLPAVFFLAGMVVIVAKILSGSYTSDTPGFMIVLGIHIFVYAAIYYLVSVLCAKVIVQIKGTLGRTIALGIVFSGLLWLTQLNVYGGGGEAPMRWHTLMGMLGELSRDYGTGAVAIVYGIGILLVCAILYLHRRVQVPKDNRGQTKENRNKAARKPGTKRTGDQENRRQTTVSERNTQAE